jgi:branched-chain amino acid transport system ATP-binding protein
VAGFLDIAGVTKRFGGLTAVDNVTLSIEAGEMVGIIGPNGSGKTTLFSVVSGFLPADAGTISFSGARLNGLKPSRIAALGIARTFQVVQPFDGLSVFDNVVVGALKGGAVQLQSARERAVEVLQFLGLWDERDKQAASLTIPGRKRLEVARALATGPRLLLLDEVMAGLRPTEVDDVIAMIRRVHAQGVTVVVVEHLMRAVLALSQRLYVLQQGRLIAEGEPREVIARPEVITAYFGEAHA